MFGDVIFCLVVVALYKGDGSKRITDATLVTMTLMIAESRPEDMEMMVKVVVNLMR